MYILTLQFFYLHHLTILPQHLFSISTVTATKTLQSTPKVILHRTPRRQPFSNTILTLNRILSSMRLYSVNIWIIYTSRAEDIAKW